MKLYIQRRNGYVVAVREPTAEKCIAVYNDEKELVRHLLSKEFIEEYGDVLETDHIEIVQADCPHYEPDLDELREATEADEAYRLSMGMTDEDFEALAAWAAGEENSDSPINKCGACCRHMKSGKGYPGEYMTWCARSGKCLDYEFRVSDVI